MNSPASGLRDAGSDEKRAQLFTEIYPVRDPLDHYLP